MGKALAHHLIGGGDPAGGILLAEPRWQPLDPTVGNESFGQNFGGIQIEHNGMGAVGSDFDSYELHGRNGSPVLPLVTSLLKLGLAF